MELFKNLLGPEAAIKIAKAIARSDASFRTDRFLKSLADELEPLELKPRMLLIKDRLLMQLPDDPRKCFPILSDALKSSDTDTVGLEGFLVWPLTQIVAERGLEHFDVSMNALHHMTRVFTGEFAVRSFLIHDEKRTLKKFSQWCEDPDENVRRLVSEGSRPLLPWAERIPSFVKDPNRTWGLLNTLRNDSSEYVRKSVANHINDHSKNHAEWVVKKLAPWHKESKSHPGLQWIIRHATRTLVKLGHSGALALHGVDQGKIKILSEEVLTPKIRLGSKLLVRVTIKNPERKVAKVILDQQVSFLKANGLTSPKVFKGKVFELNAGESRRIELALPIRKVTTRKYYFGKQLWTPIVNGRKGRSCSWQLSPS